MIIINDEKKVDILLSALKERYNSIHIIRERVQNIGIWILGILGSAGAWFFQSGIILNCTEKFFFLSFTLAAFVVIRFFYLKDQEKGFKEQFKAVACLEEILGFYNIGFFTKSESPVYPISWKKAGEKDGGGGYFRSTNLLIYVGFIFIFSILIFF